MGFDSEAMIYEAAEKAGCSPDGIRLIGRSLNLAVKVRQHRTGKGGHVTASDLCHAVRRLVLAESGFFAVAVMRHDGFRTTLDIGRAVFAMIDAGLLTRQDDDSLEDFRDVYDLADVNEEASRALEEELKRIDL